ncbi:MAG: hypothetical protein HYX68_07520 [Planctomycetes bacterium]|jgi:Zn-dependent protease|nr:hypothetical protein [Planctomycetota bacterium]
MRDVLTWSFPIGQLFGIAIRVHLLLPFVMIGLVARVALDKDFPANTWQDALSLVAMMFFIILLHEFGHCFAARFMEGESDEILMWPLGGLAYARSLPPTPIAHFVYSAGGPLVNVVLALVSGVVLFFAFERLPPVNPFWYPYRYLADSIAVETWRWHAVGLELEERLPVILLMRFFWINWILLLFNTVLLGIPFDGGRMLQAILWPRVGHFQATKIAVYAGFVCMAGVALYSVIYREPMMAFLAVFIFMSCAQELTILEHAHEDSLFGYDFSQGYTSLEKEEAPPPKLRKQNFIQRWLAQRAAKRAQEEQEQREADDRRMDDLLQKIQKFGKESLTDEEQRFLKRVADRYKNKP